MSLFSWFKKKKKNKTQADSNTYRLADHALQSSSVKPNVTPQICVASEVDLHHSAQKLTNITLVQGSSDSKPEHQSVPKHREPKQTRSIRKDDNITLIYRDQRNVNITPNPGIRHEQLVRRAPPHAQTSSQVPTYRLYPSLDPTGTHGHSSGVKKNLSAVKEPKLIHDMGREICLEIQPKILYANTIEKKLDRLKDDAETIVLTIKNMIRNFSMLDYNFKKELDIAEEYSDIRVYQKLYTFDDVRSCHQ